MGVKVEKQAKGRFAFMARDLDTEYLRSADFLKK